MKKNPAFLFYSKDWLVDTVEMLPEEKGIYIDLLAYQHQNGSLPSDPSRLAQMVGMSETQFRKPWKIISKKFVEKDSRLTNKKLCEIMNNWDTKARRNSVVGTFGVLLRERDFTVAQSRYLKQNFKVEDWLNTPSERLSICICEWIDKCIDFLGNGNNNITNTKKELLSNTTLSPEYSKFISWCEKNAPRTLEMKNPITEEEFFKLKEEFSGELIKEMLLKMHNYKNLFNNLNANLTLRNWIKLDKKRNDAADGKPRLGYSMNKKYGTEKQPAGAK